MRLKRIVEEALEQTREMFEPIGPMFAGVHAVAHALGNSEGKSMPEVKLAWEAGLKLVEEGGEQWKGMSEAAKHFERVSRSYEPGLFACFELEGMPKTNNDLEQAFGQVRHHERRASGSTGKKGSLVASGGVRLIAALTTRMSEATEADLVPSDRDRLAKLRTEVESRREKRREHRRFRQNPKRYLNKLKDLIPQQRLPT
jgi:hypothetical protein